MQREYNIYPSLLIGYQNLLDYRVVAEEDWNKTAEGDYRLTPDEMYLKLEADLIDSINRVDGRYSEAASKGTAFNEIVDCLIEGRGSSREDCRIYSAKREGGTVIIAETEGCVFEFDTKLCKDVAACFPGSLTQHYAHADMKTGKGTVHLYGFIDEWVGNEITDIKTTSKYDFGKFAKGWQRHIYPWCVIESGEATEIESFTYFVVVWAYQKKGEPVTAKGIYRETYTYDHAESGEKIREMCESFIDWLESRREFISDRKIFGGENPKGWHGPPVDVKELERVLFPSGN